MPAMRLTSALKLAAGIAMSVVTSVMGMGQTAIELKVGDAAPAFALQGSDGKMHRLADYRGQAVVLAWFPKAFTGG